MDWIFGAANLLGARCRARPRSMTPPRIAILGHTGHIGAAVRARLQFYPATRGFSRSRIDDTAPGFDLANRQRLDDALSMFQANLLIHCAGAATRREVVDDSDGARRAELRLTRTIADVARRRDLAVLHVSSVAAENANDSYGLLKRETEEAFEEVGVKTRHLRSSYALGPSPNQRPTAWYYRFTSPPRPGERRSFDDAWRFQPSALTHLSDVVCHVVRDLRPGTSTVVLPHHLTMHELAEQILPYEIGSPSKAYGDRPTETFKDVAAVEALGVPVPSLDSVIATCRADVAMRWSGGADARLG